MTIELTGREFHAVRRTVDGVDVPLVAGATVSVAFTDTGLRATGGCNTLVGGADLDGDVLVAPALVSTLMAGDPERMEQDRWLAELLSSRPRVRLAGDELVLTATGTDTGTGTGTELVLLDRRVADPDRPLVGTRWVVEWLRSPQALASVPAGLRPPTLELDERGRVGAFLGCNRGHGPVEVGEDTLRFGPLATTRMACPPEPTEVEAAVLRVLQGEVAWSVEGPVLRLDRGEHGLVLRADSGAAGAPR